MFRSYPFPKAEVFPNPGQENVHTPCSSIFRNILQAQQPKADCEAVALVAVAGALGVSARVVSVLGAIQPTLPPSLCLSILSGS